MAETIIFDIATRLAEELGRDVVKHIGGPFGVKDDLNKLGETLSTIKYVLRDAEKRQVSDGGVRSWLERLEDVVFDANNLLDEVSYEALRKNDKKVHNILLSFPKEVVFRYKVAQRIKVIRRTLQTIEADKNKFGFELNHHEEETTRVFREERMTHSHVTEDKVVGREREKKEILSLLVGSESIESTEGELMVIPIVGVGGVGKTTLAQLVYSDAIVAKRFDLKVWACVSEDFSMRSLVKKIISSVSRASLGDFEMDELQRKLREAINGRKYLIVLDDVWNEDHTKWDDLKRLLLGNGKRGNKVIITTRSDVVATITGTVEPCRLKNLDDKESWDLFKRMAFVRGEEPNDPVKVRMGKEIARKCYGVPLVIKSIGSLLISSPQILWSSFLQDLSELSNNSLSRISDNHRSGISSDSSQEKYKMHDIIHDLAVVVAGSKYATLTKGHKGKVDKRARHVSLLEFDNRNLRSSSWEIPPSLVDAKMIQSILIPTESNFLIIDRKFDSLFYKEVVSNFKYLRSLDLHDSGIDIVPRCISKLKHLRTLDLSRNPDLKTLPNSVRKLLNLQALNLTSCFNLEELPRGVSKLVNLRNLRLDYCHKLTHLPRGVGQLTSLQTLSRLVLSGDENSAEIKDLRNLNNLRGGLEIRNLGHGMDIKDANFEEKHHLESLSMFWDLKGGELEAVDHERTFRGIQPIPNLTDLLLNGYRGVGLPSWLTLRNLKTLKLEGLPNLEYITDRWDSSTTVMPFLNVLTLKYLPNLKGWWRDIKVNGDYDSLLTEPQMKLPSFPCLGSLYIKHCPQLHCMPIFPTVSWELELNNTSWRLLLTTLEHFLNRAESPTLNEAPSSSTTDFNPTNWKVQRLFLGGNKDVEYLPDYLRILSTCLSFFSLSGFSKLKSLSPGIHHFVSLAVLHIEYCEKLDMSDGNIWSQLRSLTHLRLRGLPQLVNIPEGLQHVTTLESVGLGFCHNLTSIPEWLCDLKFPLEVLECPELRSLPGGVWAEITSHKEENIFNFPYILQRLGIPEDQMDGYNCIRVPLLRLHKQLIRKVPVGDPSQSSSTSSQENGHACEVKSGRASLWLSNMGGLMEFLCFFDQKCDI
ncbi:NB-ARC domain containing protein [Parasponia andersonii]|uniref:NB-ARC domain containing protein n=1 Tax=Parasponia andersonii TaxID=3476 RepID=A0A2P5AML2_PARAD|nr:NB-ARC domain containing protein [Parasponia andersonii]